MKIAYTVPSITDIEIAYANDAVTNGWGERCYEYICKFEDRFSAHIGKKYAVATSSCTGAMTLGLKALGIGPGDEVILADINWIATASPIVHLGAKPVLVDILESTWCIDPSQVEKAITPNTRAIIATHIYGNLCDMDALIRLGEKYNLSIIEDAAEAIGSTYKMKKAGSLGHFSTFSFHGTKTITTGEGGMFLTDDAELYETVLTLSNHGRDRRQSKQFWADHFGYKFKMSNVQAAIGFGQLERVNELIARKREIFAEYQRELQDIDVISMNYQSEGTENGFWMPTVVFQGDSDLNRDIILDHFRAFDIDARIFFWPLSCLPMFENKFENENSYSISNRAINLPSFHDITTEQIQFICSAVKSLCN